MLLLWNKTVTTEGEIGNDYRRLRFLWYRLIFKIFKFDLKFGQWQNILMLHMNTTFSSQWIVTGFVFAPCGACYRYTRFFFKIYIFGAKNVATGESSKCRPYIWYCLSATNRSKLNSWVFFLWTAISEIQDEKPFHIWAWSLSMHRSLRFAYVLFS